MCGKWNAILMAIADGKAIVYNTWMLHRTCWCGRCYHIVPPCNKDVMLSKYIAYATPSSPFNLTATCPRLWTGHLLLDLHHTRLSQDLHIDHDFIVTGSRYRETQGAVGWLFYLSMSFGVLNRTSSQICGNCLGMDHSLMNIAFIFLVRFYDSLPTMLNLSTPVWWPMVVECSMYANVNTDLCV